MALHSIVENIVLDDSDGLIKIKDGAILRQFADVSAITAAVLAALPYKTAVVDIGPTTNNGPGDQTKGILDWSTTLIDLVAAPTAGKINHVIAWECQYKPGLTPYVDGAGGQGLGISVRGSRSVLSPGPVALGLLDVLPQFSDWQFIASQLTHEAFLVDRSNEKIRFGDLDSLVDGDLTDGDGTVRITVHYTVDDVLQ